MVLRLDSYSLCGPVLSRLWLPRLLSAQPLEWGLSPLPSLCRVDRCPFDPILALRLRLLDLV